jgi:hypothetical protein
MTAGGGKVKPGFVIKVKSKDKEYYYLRKAERLKENKSIKRDRNIFSFGSKEKALLKMNQWVNNENDLPDELKLKGYNLEDVSKWIQQIENK